MAGRPRGKLKRVTTILRRIQLLHSKLWEEMPQQYGTEGYWMAKFEDHGRARWNGADPDKDLPYDDRGRAWRNAVHDLCEAGISVLWLAHVLDPSRPRRPDRSEDHGVFALRLNRWLLMDEAEPLAADAAGTAQEGSSGPDKPADTAADNGGSTAFEPTTGEAAELPVS